MPAVRIGLIVIDNVTLAEITATRERLEELGARITIIVPTGGPLLPISGRYFPGAGGQAERQSISQISPGDFDVLLLPDGVTGDQLLRYPDILQLARGEPSNNGADKVPVLSMGYAQHLLDHGASLERLAHLAEASLTGKK